MEERSVCGSGGCVTCPFSYNEESEMAYNYACLPTNSEIITMKELSNHNWACHSDETVLCGGFARFLKENRPDLDVKQGNLISYNTWYLKGQKEALNEASQKKLK